MPRFLARHGHVAVLGLLLLLSALAFSVTHAQTLSLTAETTTGVESVVPKLTWSTTPAGATCTATGAADWTGAKAASGAVTLAAISSSVTYGLACTWPGDTKALLKWIAPTTNTDSTPLTNLAGFRIKYGTSSNNLDKLFELANATATQQQLSGLSAGTWFFGVLAYNSVGAESALSNVASKVVTAAASSSRNVAITVNPRPNAPSGLTAE